MNNILDIDSLVAVISGNATIEEFKVQDGHILVLKLPEKLYPVVGKEDLRGIAKLITKYAGKPVGIMTLVKGMELEEMSKIELMELKMKVDYLAKAMGMGVNTFESN